MNIYTVNHTVLNIHPLAMNIDTVFTIHTLAMNIHTIFNIHNHVG